MRIPYVLFVLYDRGFIGMKCLEVASGEGSSHREVEKKQKRSLPSLFVILKILREKMI